MKVQRLSLLILPAIISMLMLSCRKPWLTGEGAVSSQTRSTPAFTRLLMEGSGDAIVRYGPVTKVTVSDYQNLLPYIVTDVDGNSLVVKYRDHMIIAKSKLKVEIETPYFAGAKTEGSSNVTVTGPFANNTAIDYTIDGSGNVTLANDTVHDITLKINGSGKIDARDVVAHSAYITINGSGDAWVYALQYIDARINGSGSLHYKGDPQLHIVTNGSGTVHKL